MVSASVLAALVAVLQSYTAASGCPDHGVNYQPGLSHQGRVVVPADRMDDPAPALAIGEVKLPINVPASRYSNNKLLSNPSPQTDLQLGEVGITPDGNATWNGQAMTSPSDCP